MISTLVTHDVLNKSCNALIDAADKLRKVEDDEVIDSMPIIIRRIERSVRDSVLCLGEILEKASSQFPEISKSYMDNAWGFGFAFHRSTETKALFMENYRAKVNHGFEGFYEEYMADIRHQVLRTREVVKSLPEDMLMPTMMKEVLGDALDRLIKNEYEVIDFADLSYKYKVFNTIVMDYPHKFLLAENTMENQAALVQFVNAEIRGRLGKKAVKAWNNSLIENQTGMTP